MVKITLEVTIQQALAIFTLLNKDNTSSDSHNSSVWPDLPSQDPLPTKPITKPSKASNEPSTISVNTGIKMPALGRTKSQIATFENTEKERFDKKTEEELLKEECKAEREAKKAVKEAEAAEKKAEAEKALKLAMDLKKQAITSKSPKLEKPTWKL